MYVGKQPVKTAASLALGSSTPRTRSLLEAVAGWRWAWISETWQRRAGDETGEAELSEGDYLLERQEGFFSFLLGGG